MKELSFEKVIENIDQGIFEKPETVTDNTFVLVSNDKWTLNQKLAFNAICEFIEDKYNVTVKITGGGKSCSKIIIELDPNDIDNKEIQSKILADPKLQELALKMGMRWIVRVSRDESLDLKTGDVSKISHYHIDNLWNIYKMNNMDNQNFNNSGSISNSNINANLKNSEASIGHQKELVELMSELEDKINLLESSVQDSSELDKVKDDLKDLKEELAKPNPKKRYLDVIFESLKKVKSLGSVVEKIANLILS